MLFTFSKYSEFLASLVICVYSENIWMVENGFWTLLMVKSQAFVVLCQVACAVPLSLCHKSGLRYVKSWQFENDHDLGKKEQDSFRQYLLPFSSECCMYWYIKLTLFMSFCVGVKFGVLLQEKNTDWGFVRAGWWEEYLVWEGVGIEGCRRFCSELHVCYSWTGIFNTVIARKVIPMLHVTCI